VVFPTEYFCFLKVFYLKASPPSAHDGWSVSAFCIEVQCEVTSVVYSRRLALAIQP